MNTLWNKRIYHKNLERYSIQHPKSAFIIDQTQDSSLHLIENDEGLLNLVKDDKKQKLFYHDINNPIEECKHVLTSIDLDNVNLLHVFGIGLAYFYEAVLPWLKENPLRRVVFFEPDPAVLYLFFHTSRAKELLLDPQVEIILLRDVKNEADTIEDLTWDFILAEITFCTLPAYKDIYAEFFHELQQKIEYEAAVKNSLVDEYLKYGAGFFKNFYPNMLELPHSYSGTHFFEKFHGMPAIICGAGPSLNKHLNLLKSLEQKAIIFAPGSAMNALTANDIMPHFGAGIDPNAMQYKRLKQNKGFEVPFFYRNRMLYQAFMEIHGPKLYIPGAGGYDIADWFDEQLKLSSDWLDEGHNVVNFCIEIATRMGCNPVILIGLDLAFTDMQAYAKGVNDRINMTKNELVSKSSFEDRAFLRPDIYGNPVYTQWKWVAEADWIAQFINEHPETTYINATEGGIGVPGMQNINLAKVVETYLFNTYPIYDKIHLETQNSKLIGIDEERVKSLIEIFRTSLLRSIEFLDALLDDNTKQMEIAKSKQPLPQIMQSGYAALCEHELSEEIAYQYLLEIFNAVYTRVLTREAHLKKQHARTKAKQMQQAIEINRKRLMFMKDVSLANISLIDMALKGDMKEIIRVEENG